MTFDEKTRNRIGEILYIIFFALLMGTRSLGMHEGTAGYTVVLLMAVSLFVLKLIVTPHTIIEYAAVALFMGIAALVYLHTGEKGLIVYFMTMCAMKGVGHRKVIRVGMVIASLTIAFRIFTGVFGILPEKYYPQYREGIGLMFRHALGYAHPNTLHMNVFMLTTLIIYSFTVMLKDMDDEVYPAVKKNLSLIIVSLVLMAFNIYVFQYSGSRTGILASAIYLIVNVLFFIWGCNLPCKCICYAAYPVVCFISIVLPLILPDGLFDMIDRKIFTTRFSIARYFWSNNHISLWGIRLNNPDPGYRTYGLDMAHLYLFLQLGIIAFITVSVITFVFVRESLKKDMIAELAVFAGVMAAGIWEPFLYNLGFKNMCFVFMGAVLYGISSRLRDGRTDTGALKDRGPVSGLKGKAVTYLEPKFMLLSLAGALIIGAAVSGIYLAATKTPEYLYADREEDETGSSFDMDEVFLGKEDVKSIKDSGNLVVGYLDEHTPMYRYDTQIAVMEYHKKALSLGVWCSLFLIVPVGIILYKTRRYGEDHIEQ